MKTLPLLIAGASTFLGACASAPRTPPNLTHIELTCESSSVVMVEKSCLKNDGGRLMLTGYVIRRLEATSTTQTHLDVELFDASGALLRTSVEHFEPGDIPRRHRRPSFAIYRVPVDPLPATTARIAVRAHEGPHS